LLKQTDSTRSA